MKINELLAIVGIILALIILFSSALYFETTKKCIEYKKVISIEPMSIEGGLFSSGRIIKIVKYDDGSFTNYDYGDSYVGEEQCKKYNK